jgi:hypothetical protein
MVWAALAFSDRSREHSSHILNGGSSELRGKPTVRWPPKDGQPTRTVKVPSPHRRTVAGAHAESWGPTVERWTAGENQAFGSEPSCAPRNLRDGAKTNRPLTWYTPDLRPNV